MSQMLKNSANQKWNYWNFHVSWSQNFRFKDGKEEGRLGNKDNFGQDVENAT